MHGGRELVFEGQDIADKDRLKGAINEIVGRVRRQAGAWTDDTHSQIEGLTQEVNGRAEKASGGVKQAVRGARSEVRRA